jgi:mycofactocin precursor
MIEKNEQGQTATVARDDRAETDAASPEPTATATVPVAEELLVEDVSIDGMCGVY